VVTHLTQLWARAPGGARGAGGAVRPGRERGAAGDPDRPRLGHPWL